jgi:hypothetical protein
MRPFLSLATTMLAFGLSACVHVVTTNPDNYSIDTAAVAPLRGPHSVALKNAYPGEANATMPMRGGHRLVVEQKNLTDTAVVMLKRAFEKQGIRIAEDAEKTVTLRVRAVGYTQTLVGITGKVLLQAQLGDGTVISYPNENFSPRGLEHAFDGAVLFALKDFVADERLIAYMKR